MLDTSIQVKTDHFDGPLSLLLLLIQKEEMNVRDLDLTKITKQYLDYLDQMRELNFDLAGDYLYLAATLVLLKSKNCITEEENDSIKRELESSDGLNITTQAELIRRLEELQHFQKMGEKLWQMPRLNQDVFVKPKVNRKEIVNSILVPMDLEKLTLTMVDFLFRENRKYTIVKRDRLSIKEKLQFMKDNLQLGQKTDLDSLLDADGKGKNIDNIVITFISLLELARLKRITIFQNEDLGNIYVDVVKSLEDFNVDQADGFEEEGQAEADALDAELTSVINESMDAVDKIASADEITEDETFEEEVEQEQEIPEELLNIGSDNNEDEPVTIQ
ncbi:ScpA/B protein [Bacteriovorax sp. BSW11_IV]|uniref:segregation and condensation protein A n=1 Tax=Bacteriovorax sp. BSW11_IV TaxID=1353529 RepID=UPI00038A1905|nr:ScpA family protein [Bacteriovorax sp. BSW11_IV]EQC45944.1 ScpA/B protein [Bacteriovorax sp. BSW11_IV]